MATSPFLLRARIIYSSRRPGQCAHDFSAITVLRQRMRAPSANMANLMAALVALSLLACSPTDCTWSKDHTASLLSALEYLKWDNLTVVVGTAYLMDSQWAQVMKALSSASILAGINGDMGPGFNLIILDCGSPALNLNSTDLRPDATLLVAECGAELEAQLEAVAVPKAVFLSSWEGLLGGRMDRVLTVRRENRIAKCHLFFVPSHLPAPECFTTALGAELEASTLDYAPYFTFDSCDDNVPPSCRASGMVVDLFDIISTWGNFTWNAVREPSGLWGRFPPSPNATVDPSGVIGRTLTQEMDIPLSAWAMNPGREPWIDFTFTFFSDRHHCFNDPSHFEFPDPGFLARPFKLDTWGTVWVIFALNVILVVIFDNTWKEKDFEGVKLALFLGGMNFAVVNAFYGGALTMFLTSGGASLFTNIIDGLKENEDIKLILAAGDEFVFKNVFDANDPFVIELDQKYNSEEYRQTQAANLKETVLQVSQTPGSILYISKARLLNQLSNMGEDQVELNMFCDPMLSQNFLILPKDSPFTYTIKLGIVRLLERGELRRLERQWFRDIVSSNSMGFLETSPISLGHLSLANVLFGGFYFTSACILVVECIYHRHRSKKTADRQAVFTAGSDKTDSVTGSSAQFLYSY